MHRRKGEGTNTNPLSSLTPLHQTGTENGLDNHRCPLGRAKIIFAQSRVASDRRRKGEKGSSGEDPITKKIEVIS